MRVGRKTLHQNRPLFVNSSEFMRICSATNFLQTPDNLMTLLSVWSWYFSRICSVHPGTGSNCLSVRRPAERYLFGVSFFLQANEVRTLHLLCGRDISLRWFFLRKTDLLRARRGQESGVNHSDLDYSGEYITHVFLCNVLESNGTFRASNRPLWRSSSHS